MTRRLDILAAVVMVAAAGVVGCTSGTPSPAGPSTDTAPPATVTELQSAVVDGASIELSWRPSPELDLAGYRIYRSVTNPPGTRPRDTHIEADELVGSVTEPYFDDHNVVPGSTYAYGVTAFDASGNESARSWTSAITVLSSYGRTAARGGSNIAP